MALHLSAWPRIGAVGCSSEGRMAKRGAMDELLAVPKGARDWHLREDRCRARDEMTGCWAEGFEKELR